MGEGEGLDLAADLERQIREVHWMTPGQLPTAVVWDKEKKPGGHLGKEESDATSVVCALNGLSVGSAHGRPTPLNLGLQSNLYLNHSFISCSQEPFLYSEAGIVHADMKRLWPLGPVLELLTRFAAGWWPCLLPGAQAGENPRHPESHLVW